jgi:hypothetical protein
MNKNLIIGGKLGDFLLGVYGAKGLSERTGEKINIYMIDIGWELGIENTYKGLYPVLMEQDYINDFQILTDYDLDPIQTPTKNSPIKVYNKKLLEEGYIVDDYINSPLLYKKCWSDIYSHMFQFSINKPNSWIIFNKNSELTKNKVLIHRKYSTERFNAEFPYEEIIERYDGNVVFASTNINDYEQFPYKNKIPFLKVNTIEEWFTFINSCSMYVGNLTAPVVMAHAIDKLRIIELPNNLDAYHWMDETKYSNNIFWFLNKHTHTLG